MTTKQLKVKFAQVGNAIDLSQEDAKVIISHLVDPSHTPVQAFRSHYWNFLAQDSFVLKEFVSDWHDAMLGDEEEDDQTYEFYNSIDEEWSDYLDDAIDWYCDQKGFSLLGETEDHFIFVSNKLIDKGIVSERPTSFDQTLKSMEAYD